MTEETPAERSESAASESETPEPRRPDHDTRCPQCDGPTIPESDTCQHCGAPLDSGQGTPVELWEWGGALAAGFGFFLTPVLPGPVAIYCAYRVYDYKPNAAYGILAVFLSSIIFWILVPLFVLP